jgi:ArsR family transcriptional regulator
MTRRALVLGALILALPMVGLARQGGDSSVPRISQADFKKALAAGEVLVLDVRDAQSYAMGHIPGAINVPLSDLQKKAPELKAAKKTIVAYCA